MVQAELEEEPQAIPATQLIAPELIVRESSVGRSRQGELVTRRRGYIVRATVSKLSATMDV